MTDPGIGEALFLVHNGVPFDLAFELPDETRAAFAIKFSEFGGAEFDWSSMTFKEPKT